jgi:hypothetical protein
MLFIHNIICMIKYLCYVIITATTFLAFVITLFIHQLIWLCQYKVSLLLCFVLCF